MIFEKVKERHLPDVLTFKNGKEVENPLMLRKRREQIIHLLRSQVYGFPPPLPTKVDYLVKWRKEDAFAGKSIHMCVDIKFETSKGKFSFPINLIIPKKISPAPLLLHIAFRPDIPDKYYPVEEIVDNGFATASFCYKDVAPDTDDGFVGGLAGIFNRDNRSDQWGKISLWAWAAQRVMDYLQTLKEIDSKRIAVVGHSRLGKTALWCAAQDERFIAGVSNCSGCSGAALSRGKNGEQIKDITDTFPYWFCKNYQRYRENEEKMPFDQHFLLAAIAPRVVYVGSAQSDDWADPESEFLACVAASRVYELLGLKGLVTEDKMPEPGIRLHKGQVGYHIREGGHFFSRDDWKCIMDYMNEK